MHYQLNEVWFEETRVVSGLTETITVCVAKLPTGMDIVSAKLLQIADFCRRWQIVEFAVFGSALRDDFRPDSDIDVLVTLAADANWSLLTQVHAQDELSALLGRKVDLADRQGIEQSQNPLIRREILGNARMVWQAETPWTEAELADLLKVEPLTGEEIVARGLLGGWEDLGISDPVAWVEALRGPRRQGPT